eukprot:scaffold8600_cov111-Cylindrotheca_fusiformis.AAC.3
MDSCDQQRWARLYCWSQISSLSRLYDRQHAVSVESISVPCNIRGSVGDMCASEDDYASTEMRHQI